MSQRRPTFNHLQQGLFRRPEREPQWSVLPLDVQQQTTKLVAALLRAHRARNRQESNECVAHREESND